MQEYPETVATVQDFKNLLAMAEYRKQALADLQKIFDLADDEIQVDRTPADVLEKIRLRKLGPENAITETIQNPMPMWKRRGFKSRDDVLKMIQERA